MCGCELTNFLHHMPQLNFNCTVISMSWSKHSKISTELSVEECWRFPFVRPANIEQISVAALSVIANVPVPGKDFKSGRKNQNMKTVVFSTTRQKRRKKQRGITDFLKTQKATKIRPRHRKSKISIRADG